MTPCALTVLVLVFLTRSSGVLCAAPRHIDDIITAENERCVKNLDNFPEYKGEQDLNPIIACQIAVGAYVEGFQRATFDRIGTGQQRTTDFQMGWCMGACGSAQSERTTQALKHICRMQCIQMEENFVEKHWYDTILPTERKSITYINQASWEPYNPYLAIITMFSFTLLIVILRVAHMRRMRRMRMLYNLRQKRLENELKSYQEEEV